NLLSQPEKSFNNKKFLIIMIALVVTSLIDISVVRVNDLINKDYIPMQSKLILFTVNSSLCLLLQYFILKQVKSSFRINRLNRTLKIKAFYLISLTSLCVLAVLIGFTIFEQFYYNQFDTLLTICIISISYGTAAALMIWLSLLFLSWYKSNRSLIVLLYFISIVVIAFNLIVTAAYVNAKMSDRPTYTAQYVGGSADVSGGQHLFLQYTYIISNFISYVSIWATTVLLMNNYRDKLANAIIYWIIFCLPHVYFLITFFYQFIFSNILISYLEIDPITVSIVLGAFLSLSKPIGGVFFAVAFWKISTTVSYEKNIKTYMIIAGCGIFLIFSANQAEAQITGPYPPFGVATLTALSTAAFLMLIGIYNSAVLVSANNDLRKTIYKYALESKLLGQIGRAEMESEIQKTVTTITNEKKHLMTDTEQPVELDGMELKKYLEFVIREVKKDNKQ
ncbi:MAG: hypothetical protein WAJ93_04895, partial [Candidatus Nitrosopolaris sp.]